MPSAADIGAATAEEVIRLKADKLDKTGTAADSSKLGGKAPEYYIQPRNLLDNSGFEIAQAGYGRYHGSTIYAADRWMQNDSTVRTYEKVTRNGHGALKCNASTQIQQKLFLVDGQAYTGAFYINDKLCLRSFRASGGSYGSGEIWIDYQSDGTYIFVISDIPAGGVVSEPVLYPGTYTAETLPPYVPKGYVAELAECQRYYRRGVQAVTIGKLYTDDGVIFSLDYPQMRITSPTITLLGIDSQGWGNVDINNYAIGWGADYGSKHIDSFVSTVTADAGKTVDVKYESIADL